MELKQLFKIIAANKSSMTEMEIVREIQTITKVDFDRAISGYKMMRQQGIINSIVEKNTIGTLEKILNNEKMMNVIKTFDGQITNIDVGTENIIRLHSDSYDDDEIIPITKMTRNEIRKWLSDDLNRIDMNVRL